MLRMTEQLARASFGLQAVDALSLLIDGVEEMSCCGRKWPVAAHDTACTLLLGPTGPLAGYALRSWLLEGMLRRRLEVSFGVL